jgi:hypothetical protein
LRYRARIESRRERFNANPARSDERANGKEREMSDTTSSEAARPSPRIIDVIAYMALTFGIGIAVSMVLAGAVLFLNHAPV